jgi:hypothetical protein
MTSGPSGQDFSFFEKTRGRRFNPNGKGQAGAVRSGSAEIGQWSELIGREEQGVVQQSSGPEERDATTGFKHAEPLSLGRSVLAAHGINLKNEPVVVVQNFIPGMTTDQRFGDRPVPVQVDPLPNDNKSTNHLAVPSLQDGEIAITTTLAPGLEEYYRTRGLIPDTAKIISFDGEAGASYARTGYPHFDPLSLAERQGYRFDGEYFVSAFTSEAMREQAMRLGLRPIQMSDSSLTNDKVDFNLKSSQYGYRCSPATIIRNEDDIRTALDANRGAPVWIKFSRSFGGDLLQQAAAGATVDDIKQQLCKMRRSFELAASSNDYGRITTEDLWPESSLVPAYGGVLIERDARYLDRTGVQGDVLVNGSNLMQVTADGQCVVKAMFRQLVGKNGDFLGSTSFDPVAELGSAVSEELHRQFQLIGEYCREELKLYGLVGVDFMVVEGADGRIRVVMIELNGRPPLSACSYIMGSEKLRAPFWMNKAVWAPNAIASAADFEALTFDGTKYLSRTSVEEGAIIPMYIASVFRTSRSGIKELVIPKTWMQVLVAGEDQAHCESLLAVLARNGVKFSPPKEGEW